MFVFLISAIAAFLVSGAATLLSKTFLHGRIALLGSFAGLERSFNPGIAFGIRLPIQDALITAALCAVVYFAWRFRQLRFQQLAFGLIAGGAIANIADRLADGYVTDYFQVGSFPVFNVADSCITVGVFLLLMEGLWRKR